jgi:outer membrane biosynthesis protein TonB
MVELRIKIPLPEDPAKRAFVIAIVGSILLHVVLLAWLITMNPRGTPAYVKRGEPLLVDMAPDKPEEKAPLGNPSKPAGAPAAPLPRAPEPPAPTPRMAEAPPPPKAPPAPKAPAPPKAPSPQRAAPPTRPAPEPPKQVAKAEPAPPTPKAPPEPPAPSPDPSARVEALRVDPVSPVGARVEDQRSAPIPSPEAATGPRTALLEFHIAKTAGSISSYGTRDTSDEVATPYRRSVMQVGIRDLSAQRPSSILGVAHRQPVARDRLRRLPSITGRASE